MPRALVYASIDNNVNEGDDLIEFSDKYGINYSDYRRENKLPGESDKDFQRYNDVSRTQVKRRILNEILKDTNLKRACCRATGTVDARIPIPEGVDLSVDCLAKCGNNDKECEASCGADQYYDPIGDRFKYFDVEGLRVPDNVCPAGYSTQDKDKGKCDDFYTVYCANMLKMYKKQKRDIDGENAKYKHSEFVKYKPECACHGDLSVFKNIPTGMVRKCIFSGCDNQDHVYMHKDSRGESCDSVNCNTIINADNIDAGGDVSIVADMNQQCGRSGATESNTGFMGSGGNSSDDDENDNSSNDNSSNDNSSNDNSSNDNSSNDNSSNDNSSNDNSSDGKSTLDNLPVDKNVLYGIIGVVLCFCCVLMVALLAGRRK